MEQVTNDRSNKKNAYIVISVIFFVTMILTTSFILSKHDNTRHSITIEEFNEAAKESGYELGTDSDFLEKNKDLEDISIAMDKEDDYQFEFLVFKDEEKAKEFFEIHKKNMIKKFKPQKGSNTNFGNYNNYNITTDTEYVYLTRADKTFFYARVDKEYKAEVKAFVDKIKY